jgi:sec-independent protein translocase protein TatB
VFLFIFESIGTQELVLIGIAALIFLGPRRMPEMARKLGKMMSDFRNTANEFKATWEREVNFDDEERALRTGELPSDSQPIARATSILPADEQQELTLPEVRAADPAEFENLSRDSDVNSTGNHSQINDNKVVTDLSAKENWL